MRLRLILACGLVMAGVAVAQDAAKRPMTFADLQAMKRVSDPQISPSGKWVMFSVTDVSLEKNTKVNHLWVVPIGGGKEVQVSHGKGESNGRFSPDGGSVMYTSSQTGSSQIWVAPWNDDKGRMGVGAPVTALETEADGAIWAPDSQHFLFVSEVYPECESMAAMGPKRDAEEVSCNAAKDAEAAKSPVKALVFTELLYRHWDSYQGAKRSHVFYGSVEGGAPTDLTPASVVGDHVAPTFSLGGPLGYAISPDGKEVAYVVNLQKGSAENPNDIGPAASTNNDVFTWQVGTEPGTAKKVSTSLGSDDGPAYSPDGKWLAWRSQKRDGFESDLFKLVVMDRSSGAIKDVAPLMGTNEKREVVGDNWVDEFVWSPDSLHIAYASPDRGKEIVTAVGISSAGATMEWKAIEGELGSLVFASKDTLVASRMYVSQPTDLVTVRHSSQAEKGYDIAVSNTSIEQITHLNDALLASLDLAKLESFWFEGAAKTQVQGFIIRPPNFDASKKYPVKFVMHGGPQTALGDGWSYRWNMELLAANGYVVVAINRRGSTGYGQKFVDEVSGDWGGKAFVDLMKGLDYAEKTYPFIDKTRECALGASYGGFMANWVLTHTNRFKCVVTHDGMYNPSA